MSTYFSFQLVSDPPLDFLPQHPEREAAVFERDVVEHLDVEARAEFLARLLAQSPNLEAADHVGRRLAGHGDVAVHFRLRAVLRLGRVRKHVVDRLLPRPSQRVHAGIHDQPRGAQALVRQQAEPVDVRAEQSHFIGQTLGIEAPAFAES